MQVLIGYKKWIVYTNIQIKKSWKSVRADLKDLKRGLQGYSLYLEDLKNDPVLWALTKQHLKTAIKQ